MKITLTWADFKTQLAKGLPYRYLSISSIYYIYAVDGPFHFECLIHQNNGDDHVDFETTYKNTAFTTLSQFDTDGAQIVRQKAAKKGWSFWAVPIEFKTSTLLGSLFAKDVTDTAIPGISCKIYDEDDVEITTAGLANINLLACVKTVIDFEPLFDYEIIGGALRVNSTVTQDVRMWIVGAPDIPAIYGGSKEFASGINLKYLAPDNSFDMDGRVTKFLTYNASTHTSKMRIILKHPAGANIDAQLVIHIYRQ